MHAVVKIFSGLVLLCFFCIQGAEAQTKKPVHKGKATPVKVIHYDTMIFVKANALYNKNFWWVMKGGKWGILNATKKVVVPCIYDIPYVEWGYSDGSEFEVSNPVIMLKDSLAVLVDLGKGVISRPFIYFLDQLDSHFVFQGADNKYGVLNRSGKTVIPAISEKCITPVFDSLLLLYYDGNYALHDRNNHVVLSPGQFTERDIKNTIQYLILNGALSSMDRFDFDTKHIPREDLIPAFIFYQNHYTEEKFKGLNKMLDGFMAADMSDCNIAGCFRYLDGFMEGVNAYQIDLDCDRNIYTNKDNPYYEIKGLGDGLVEYRMDELSASEIRVYYQISHFRHCSIQGDRVDTLSLSDFFTPVDSALLEINRYMTEFMNGEEGREIPAMDSASQVLNAHSNFSLDKDGVSFWLLYDTTDDGGYESEEQQYELTIPYGLLEKYIPAGGYIERMRTYFEEVE